MITALAGGVGASKFLDGLSRVAPPEEISIIVNTGDDIEMFGLYIAPDLDIVTYTLAGMVNPETGWGLAGDTFNCSKISSGLGSGAKPSGHSGRPSLLSQATVRPVLPSYMAVTNRVTTKPLVVLGR